MTRREGLALLVLTAGFVLLTLNRTAAYDFQRYDLVSGFEASRWTWLLVAGAATFALVSQFANIRLQLAAGLSAIAAVCVSITIFWTVSEAPHRVEAVHNDDCSNQNIGIGCQMNRLLDTSPPKSAPSHALIIAALGTYGLVAGTLTLRKPSV